jgi:DNA invertase Pin-like site-specific DNA recombinase
MRVIVAARLSRIAKGQTGIDTQDEDAREWAEEHGHEIISTVADRKSGTAAMWDRPNLKPWVSQDDYMELYDGIVAAKQDRLSRADWSDEARIRLWAEENGKSLFIVDRNLQWPPRDADDRERWNNGAEQARREWENTSKRYQRMHRSLRDQHYFVGKRTYGYRIVEAGDHKTLEIDEDQARVVREMFQRYLAGESLIEIRNWLVAAKIPAPQPRKDDDGNPVDVCKTWSSQAVRRILSNPVMTGRVMVHGRTYLRVTGIIEPADFEKVREALDSKATRGKANKPTAMLTGIIRCEHGHPMFRLKGRQIPSVPDGMYYYCSAEVAPKGQRHLVPMTEADQAANDFVMSFDDQPNFIMKMSPAQKYANQIAEVKAEIRELDPMASDFMERVAEKRAELERLQELASKAAESKPTLDRKPDGTIRFIGEAWESMDTAAKRAWLLERGVMVIAHKVPRTDGNGHDYTFVIDPGDIIQRLESLRGLPSATL